MRESILCLISALSLSSILLTVSCRLKFVKDHLYFFATMPIQYFIKCFHFCSNKLVFPLSYISCLLSCPHLFAFKPDFKVITSFVCNFPLVLILKLPYDKLNLTLFIMCANYIFLDFAFMFVECIFLFKYLKTDSKSSHLQINYFYICLKACLEQFQFNC